MTQRDVVRVISATARYMEAMQEPPEVVDKARDDINAVLSATVEAMAFEGLTIEDIIKRIKGE